VKVALTLSVSDARAEALMPMNGKIS